MGAEDRELPGSDVRERVRRGPIVEGDILPRVVGIADDQSPDVPPAHPLLPFEDELNVDVPEMRLEPALPHRSRVVLLVKGEHLVPNHVHPPIGNVKGIDRLKVPEGPGQPGALRRVQAPVLQPVVHHGYLRSAVSTVTWNVARSVPGISFSIRKGVMAWVTSASFGGGVTGIVTQTVSG